MGTLTGPAVGARTQVEVMAEVAWGVLQTGLLLGTNGHGVTLTSESIKNNIGELISATLSPSRGVVDTIRGQADVSGDLNFEYKPDAGEYSNLIKHAMCTGASPSANYFKVRGAAGHLGLQVKGTQLAATPNRLLKGPAAIANLWPAPGAQSRVIFIQRTAAGILTSQLEVYTLVTTVGQATLLTIAAPAGDAINDAWAFPIDTSYALWGATWLHYLEVGAHIGIGMEMDILRDISLFVYTGLKPNTWTMNFNAGEIVTGVFSYIGKEELCGGRLVAESINAAGPVVLNVDDVRIFNDGMAMPSALGGTLMIGGESVAYASLAVAGGLVFPAGQITTGAAPGGSLTLGTDPCVAGAGYFIGTPVSPQDSRANFGGARKYLYDDTVLELTPYTSFEATIRQEGGLIGGPVAPTLVADDVGVAEIEVINCTFTLDNGLYTDKYALGSRARVMMPEQKRNVTGTLTMEFDNLYQYRKFVDGTEFGFLIRLVSEGEFIDNTGVGSQDIPYCTCFYFHRCKYTGETPVVGGPDIIMSDMPFRALYHDGDITNPVAATDHMGFPELVVWFSTTRSADLWTA